MADEVLAFFGKDIKIITNEAKKGSQLTGYFIVSVFRALDGQLYQVTNYNYDAPIELLGAVHLEQTQLALKVNSEMMTGKTLDSALNVYKFNPPPKEDE